MHYEVQHYTLAQGWRNTWSYDEGDGVIHAETFATQAEAEAALDEFFADIAEDIAAGFCPPCTRDEFRIRCVPDPATVEPAVAAGGAL
jgi:hypothetical protein